MGGVFAALAVVIMNLGGLIPMATYVCPTLCMVILSFVHMACGRRIAWSWYAAVSILSLLMSPDKEAAAVFAWTVRDWSTAPVPLRFITIPQTMAQVCTW